MEDFIPDEIIEREKIGFCGSVTNMLSESINKYAYEVTKESSLIKEIFDWNYIEEIFQIHKKKRRFYSQKIWTLMNLALWHSLWFNKGN